MSQQLRQRDIPRLAFERSLLTDVVVREGGDIADEHRYGRLASGFWVAYTASPEIAVPIRVRFGIFPDRASAAAFDPDAILFLFELSDRTGVMRRRVRLRTDRLPSSEDSLFGLAYTKSQALLMAVIAEYQASNRPPSVEEILANRAAQRAAYEALPSEVRAAAAADVRRHPIT